MDMCLCHKYCHKESMYDCILHAKSSFLFWRHLLHFVHNYLEMYNAHLQLVGHAMNLGLRFSIELWSFIYALVI